MGSKGMCSGGVRRDLGGLARRVGGLLLLLLCPTGCETPEGNAALVAAGATVAGGYSPSQEIEQTYYVGVFDPTEQVPQAVYRLTVRGQASFLSDVKFASGWVPAPLIDGLGTRISFDGDGNVDITASAEGAAPGAGEAGIGIGRRLMMFGPEGFREAPADHRLVIVFSSTPEEFFKSVGDSLQAVVKVQQERRDSTASQRILEELLRLQEEERQLLELQQRLDAPTSGGKEQA
jgi:hypothetical protein